MEPIVQILETPVLVSAVTFSDLVKFNETFFRTQDIWSNIMLKGYCNELRDGNGANFDFTQFEPKMLREEVKNFVIHKIIDDKIKHCPAKRYFSNILAFEQYAADLYGNIDSASYITDEMINVISTAIKKNRAHFVGAIKEFCAYTNKQKQIDLTGEWTPQMEMEQDIWDLDELGFPVSGNPSKCKRTLNFSRIRLPWLRSVTKKYAAERLRTKSSVTVSIELICIGMFSDVLIHTASSAVSLDTITLRDADNTLDYCKSLGYGEAHWRQRICGIMNFLSGCFMLGLSKADASSKFINYSTGKKVRKLPKTYSKREIELIYASLNDMPVEIGRALHTIMITGWRASDVLNMKCREPFIEINGVLNLKTVQQKTSKLVFSPCMDDNVPLIIQESIADSRRKFGEDCEYVFAKSADLPIQYSDLWNIANETLSKNGALADSGKPLKIETHTLRRTKISDLVEHCNIDPNIVRRILGHTSVGSLSYYVRITDAEYEAKIQPILDEFDEMVRTKGMSDKAIAMAEGKPLIDGVCVRPMEAGECKKIFGSCYACKCFHALKEFLPYYKSQYEEQIRVGVVSRARGAILLADKADEASARIKAIIDKLEAGL